VAPERDPNLQRIRDLRAEINEAIAHHNLPHAAILFLELRNLDPRQVLARQAQLDIANQLASQQFFPQAADAYEQFLVHYPNFEQIEQVQLMLGLICGRYLEQYDRAKSLLAAAAQRLHGERELSMARAELQRIEPLVNTNLPGD
jgi:outer membrane protein assembly factor BamD (BamD/ComL family)